MNDVENKIRLQYEHVLSINRRLQILLNKPGRRTDKEKTKLYEIRTDFQERERILFQMLHEALNNAN